MQLLIYTPNITPRVKYIFNFIFREVILCDFELTSVSETFKNYNGPKFSYAEKPISHELFFKAEGLLTRYGIEKLTIDTTKFGDDTVPFAINDSALPFDIFAASFYFVSRYEEYLEHVPDQHGRYPAKNSLQYELGLLQKPIVDFWALMLKNLLTSKLENIHFGAKKFQFIPTIDIDRAFHFQSTGLINNGLRIIKAALTLNTERLNNIIKTGLRKQKDPFDTYEFFHKIHDENNLEAIFFFLLAQKGDKNHDVNLSPDNLMLQQVIKETALYAKIGIHPSYISNIKNDKLVEEKKTLEHILGKTVILSRQHYLKLHLPTTYLELIKANIHHDYTMGYASEAGFRAGTCTPFFWYDLQLEKQSHLQVHPFAIMDATLHKYLNLDPEQSILLIKKLIDNVKLVNGTFYSVWHNESVSETAHWKGWRKVYEQMISLAK